MTLDRQVQALLDLVEADRAQKCEAILNGARTRARALLREAHADARSRMRVAFDQERERRNARVAAASANLQTRQRLARQHRAAALLAAAWQKLPDALVARWAERRTRCAWVARVAASARTTLPNRVWRIAHAGDWPAPERDALAREFAATLGVAPTFVSDPRIRAGLRIVADGNVVDGSLDGLLADRAEIGAMLLDRLERTEREPAPRAKGVA